MIGGGLGIVLGSILPWTTGPGATSGLGNAGPITLAIGLALVLLAFSARATPSYAPRILVAVSAVMAVVFAYLDVSGGPTGIGVGIKAIFVGGIAAAVGSVLRER